MAPRSSECPVNGPTAGWARVSSEVRDETSQVEQIEEFARRINAPLVHVYRDPGRRRAELEESKVVAEMIADAEEGRFKWLVTVTQDRLGTLHVMQLMAFLHKLLSLGVRVWVIDREKELTSIEDIDILTTVLNSQSEVKEQRSKAGHVLRGMLSLAKSGHFLGGATPYGFDRICVGEDGAERFRVIHLRSEPNPRFNPNERISKYNQMNVHHYRVVRPDGSSEVTKGRPAIGVGEHYTYAVSEEPGRVETVRLIFGRFASERISAAGLARELNLDAPDEASRGTWTEGKVQGILENSLYFGVRQYLRKIAATYQTLDKDGRYQVIPVKGPRDAKTSTRPVDERIFVEMKHAAIIDEKTADRVRTKLSKSSRGPRNPRDANFWLSPWMWCGTCGTKMHGKKRPGGKLEYRCPAYVEGKLNGPRSCSTPNQVKVEMIESLLKRWLDEQGEAAAVELSSVASPRLEAFLANEKAHHGIVASLRDQMVDYVRGRLPESQWDLLGQPGGLPLIATYHRMFTDEQAETQREIDALTSRVTKQSLSLAYFNAGDPAHDAILSEILRLQDEIAVAKRRLVPLDQQIVAAVERIKQAEREIQEARRHLEGRRNRRAAEVLGKVLGRIEVHSEASGYKRGGGMAASRVAKVTFVSAAGQVTEYDMENKRDYKAILEAVLTLRREGKSMAQIADALQAAGYPTVRADRWKWGAVHRMLKNHAPEMLPRAYVAEQRATSARTGPPDETPSQPEPAEPTPRRRRSPRPQPTEPLLPQKAKSSRSRRIG